MNKHQVLDKIASMKRLPFRESDISCDLGGKTFHLLFLTEDCVNDAHILQLLTDWRRENQHYFPAIFPVSFEGTRKWYQNKLIDVPDRLLFMVECDGAYIGHVGLFRFHFDRQVCDIDNIVRGVQGFPGIMTAAIAAMMGWGRLNLGVRDYLLETSSDSVRALNVYHQLGFIEIKREEIVQIRSGERLEWVLPDLVQPHEVLARRFNIHMGTRYAGV